MNAKKKANLEQSIAGVIADLNGKDVIREINFNAAFREMAKNASLPRQVIMGPKQAAAFKRAMLEQCARALYRRHRHLSRFLRRFYLNAEGGK